MKKWFLYLGIFLGLLFIAFSFRIYNLTILPVFADEAIYIRWSQVMRSVPELRFLPLSDGKQPLFMWVVIPFLKLFSDPLFASRFVSVLCGLGTMVGIFVLTVLLFTKRVAKDVDEFQWKELLDLIKNDVSIKVALVASLLYALSPFAVFFDRIALADSMLSMFGIWTFICALLSVRYQRLDMAMLSGFCLGGALLTKSPALYFSILLPISLLFFRWEKKDRVRRALTTISLWFVSYGIGYGFYNILRLGPNYHMLSSRNLDYVYPVNHIFERPFDPLIPFLHRVWEWLVILGPFTLVILVALGILFNIKRYPREILFLTILAFAPIIASAEYAKVFTARYIFFSLPYLMILGASTLSSQGNKKNIAISIKGKSFLAIASHALTMIRVRYLLLIIFVSHSLFINYQLLTNPENVNLPRSERSGYLEEWTAGQGIKEISQYLKNEYQNNPNQKIVVGTEGYFGTLPDGLQLYMNDRPEVTIIGVGQPIRNVHASLQESKKAGNKTYLVVNDTRLLEDPDMLHLRLVGKYEKAVQPDGTREHLLFFEVL